MRWRTVLYYALLILPALFVLLFFLTITSHLTLTPFALLGFFLLSLCIILVSARYTDRKVGALDDLADALRTMNLHPDTPVSLPDSRGEIGTIIHSIRGILDRRDRQVSKLDRDRDRLMTVLTYMADGVIILNRSGRVRLLNPAAERLMDVRAQTAMGSTFIQTARDHRIATLWQQCQAQQEEIAQALELVDNRFVQVVITPFLKGAARGYLVLIQDLTEMRRLQTVRQDFVTNVSHELRTPLASLRALAETLNDGALEDPPAARRFLQRIEVEVDALSTVVNDLLDLSLIESGKMPLSIDTIQPHALIIPPVERLQPQAEKAAVDLLVDVATDLPTLKVDVSQLHQVIINLVHNAIKFTPAGGEIRVAANERNNAIHVTVTDTGVGIAPEDVERLFERFYKSDRARAGGGSGLGLAIAKHVVQAHKGQIWVESNEGEGSKFTFSLPIVN